jgi:SAM-dependent methyltransferase
MSQQACPYCGSQNAQAAYRQASGSVVRCPECDLIFRATRGDDEQWAQYYRLHYFRDFGEEQEGPRREVIYGEALDAIERLGPKGALFDIGAGSGTLLAMAASRGWAVSGQEISTESCRLAGQRHGLELIQADLKDLSLAPGAYQAITMVNVLDHLPEPWPLLEKSYRALRPGGVLYVRVPHGGFHNLGLRLAAAVPESVWNGRIRNFFVLHRYHITPRFIRTALGQLGFRPVIVRPSAPSRGVPYAGLRRDERCAQITLKWIAPMLSSVAYDLSGGKWVLSPSIHVYGMKV